MKKPIRKSSRKVKEAGTDQPSEKDSVSYIKDLLDSLEGIARSHGQVNLAHFIHAAASEAAELVKQH